MDPADFRANRNNTLDIIVRPTHYKWVIIKNERYDRMRTYEGYENFADMPEVNEDAEVV